MPSVSRITDLFAGICCCHDGCDAMTGILITGSADAKSNELGVGGITGLVLGHCGHIGTVVTGSSVNTTDSLGKATVGSLVTGCLIGTMVTGSPDHETGL